MGNFNLAVYIGRFQPVHVAHLEIMKTALSIADRLLIVIGSRNLGRRTFKNPWTWRERHEMIMRSLEKSDVVTHRVHIMSAFDVPGDDDAWREQVYEGIDDVVYDQMVDDFNGDGPDPKVTLIGHTKDESSYYLQTFPRLVYSPVAVPQFSDLNATDLRKLMRDGSKLWEQYVPPGAREYLQDWLRTHDLPKEG